MNIRELLKNFSLIFGYTATFVGSLFGFAMLFDYIISTFSTTTVLFIMIGLSAVLGSLLAAFIITLMDNY